MKKPVKRFLKVLLSLLGIILLALVVLGLYINASLLSFGLKPSPPDFDIRERAEAGFLYRDLNGNNALDPYEDSRLPLDARAADLLSRLSMEEKINLLKGSGMKSMLGMGEPEYAIPGAAGTIEPIPRLGLPRIYLADGPAGLRINPQRKGSDKTYYATAYPIATLLASSWNTELVGTVGEAMGNEVLEYGLDVILGPGANIQRNPLCGRNFEYYSEDPVLTGKIGAAMVNGIESNGVGTSVKHFVANNQETSRYSNDAVISGRALREIYLKGFEIIVRESQPWTVMSSYNKVNGTYTSQNRELLTDILRGEWGYRGVVVTDWFGGADAVAQVKAGNDLLEPGTKKQWKALKTASEEGRLSGSEIDTAAMRILKLVLGSKKMEAYAFTNAPDLERHARVAREAASEGMVLLKNEGVLPLERSQKLALFGVGSFEFITGGTGSGDVNEAYTVALEEGLKSAGFSIDPNTVAAFEAHKKANPEGFARPEGLDAMLNPFTPPQFVPSPELVEQAAADSDVAVITLGRNAGEGGDRVETDDFLLTAAEQSIVRRVSEAFHNAGKKVVVVLNIGGVIETASWKPHADAILLAWQGGQEGGHAVADILDGSVTPSGKLPMTFPVNLKDHGSSANFPMDGEPINLTEAFLGVEEKPISERVKNKDYTLYEEGIYVGYRHFDKQKINVSYPFGFGLSYTEFQYANMEVTLEKGWLDIGLWVKNTGTVPGKEVVQLYSAKPATAVDRPVRELRAFSKTPLLRPGDSTQLKFTLPVSELAYWNEAHPGWEVEPGAYSLEAGASSRDLRLAQEVEIPSTGGMEDY